MDVSVVVVTYKPDYKKLFSTLKSIICQKKIDFEIIVADDGSEFFDEEKVREWFKANDYANYRFVLNPNNQGTMKNAYSGWKVAKGLYIKHLSPGDMLFSEFSLFNALTQMKRKNLEIGFGLAASYFVKDGKISLVNVQNPTNLAPYYSNNRDEIVTNYVCFRDYANGAAFILKRDLLLKYAEKLLGKVIYTEDCTYILIVANESKFGFIEDYLIWYEYGEGISTSGSDSWRKKIFSDNVACFKVLSDMNSDFSYIYLALKGIGDNIFLRVFFKLFKMAYKFKHKKRYSSPNLKTFGKKVENVDYLRYLLSNKREVN